MCIPILSGLLRSIRAGCGRSCAGTRSGKRHASSAGNCVSEACRCGNPIWARTRSRCQRCYNRLRSSMQVTKARGSKSFFWRTTITPNRRGRLICRFFGTIFFPRHKRTVTGLESFRGASGRCGDCWVSLVERTVRFSHCKEFMNSRSGIGIFFPKTSSSLLRPGMATYRCRYFSETVPTGILPRRPAVRFLVGPRRIR